MTMRRVQVSFVVVIALLAWLPATPAAAQAVPAGVVTALDGSATVVRVATGQAAPLKFHDDVFLFDRIVTGEQSTARILLGGRGLVTIRERSELTITSVPGTTAVDVVRGKLALAVIKSLMTPGEVIEIRAPHAIAGIRGTVVIAEVGDVTTFTVLRGLVEVHRLDPAGRVSGSPVNLGPLHRVTVTGAAPLKPHPIAPDAAQRIVNDYKIPLRDPSPATTAAVSETHVREVARDIAAAMTHPSASGDSGPDRNDPRSGVTGERRAGPGAQAGKTSGPMPTAPATAVASSPLSPALSTPPTTPSAPVSAVTPVSPVPGTLASPTGLLSTTTGVVSDITRTLNSAGGSLTSGSLLRSGTNSGSK